MQPSAFEDHIYRIPIGTTGKGREVSANDFIREAQEKGWTMTQGADGSTILTPPKE